MAPAIAERAGQGKQGLGRREKRVIVTCPNCGAQYRLAPEIVARGTRLRCAACDHRWVPVAEADPEPPPAAPPPPPPVTEADEEAAFAAVQEQLQARWQGTSPPEPAADADADAESETADETAPPPRSGLARTIVAFIAGLALAVVAAGLWIRPTERWADLGRLPHVGPLLARLDPPSPLRVTVRGQVTVLPSGKRLLEVSGSIANPGPVRVRAPALAASLIGPAGPALRWTIPAPVAMLPAGQQVEFASTVTGFPAEARTLAVTPAG